MCLKSSCNTAILTSHSKCGGFCFVLFLFLPVKCKSETDRVLSYPRFSVPDAGCRFSLICMF